MSWKKVHIADICEIKSGKRIPKGFDFSPITTDYRYIRARDIKKGKVDSSDLGYISKEVKDKIARYIVQEDDVVVSIAGTIGEVGYVPSELDGVNLTENAVRLTNFTEGVFSKFVLYWLMTEWSYEYMNGVAAGSAQPKLGIYKIEQIPISLPSFEIQHRIADILSAYDDLIENNRKQIKLLEEAAQRLYKEWFVDLRFPGYEHTKITDGVPEGWKIDLLSNIVKTTSGGTPARSHPEYYINGSTLWVKTQELLDAFILDTEEKITDEAITNSSTKLVSKGSILMAMYGATIGKLGIASQDLTCNQACCVFDVSGFKYGGMYLFCWLFENRKFLIKLGKGVAQSNLSQTMIKNLNILIPDMNVLHQFSCIVDSLYSEILANQKRITILSEARDRLLPKLMSGEVEV